MSQLEHDLIIQIQEIAKQLGRTPTRREFGQSAAIRKYFGTWNNALEKAGLSLNNRGNYTKEEIIEIFNKWVQENGRIPKSSDFDTDNTLPPYQSIKRYFNMTYSQFLDSLDIQNPEHSVRYKDTDKEILQLLLNEVRRLKTTNKLFFNKNRLENIPSFSYYEKRFNTSWNRVLILAGLKKDELINFRHTKEELIDILTTLVEKLGHPPSNADLIEHGYDINIFKSQFPNLNTALAEAGFTPINKTPVLVKETNEELLQMYIDFSNQLGKAASIRDLEQSNDIYNSDVFTLRFGSMYQLKRLAGYDPGIKNRKYTKSELADKLIALKVKNGAQPSNRYLKENGISISTVLRYFQTTKMSEVWKELKQR